ncbi:MAG: YicC family protein [Clostridia bacterium]|nr:YicC family protein [Clostridia bacterium]MBR6741952.1 YicC family protein [Clostridia bacterium]
MIYSMTAFGRGVLRTETHDITVEVRSVNNRFLDCTVKLPRIYSFLEERVKAYIASRGITRGKVEVYISIEATSNAGPAAKLTLDKEYAEAYINALRELGETFGLTNDISLMRVAANRDIFRTEKAEHDEEADWQMILPALSDAMDVFVAARAAEGAKIEKDIRAKIAGIERVTPDIAALSEQDILAKKEKLTERIRKLLGEENIIPDESRLLTECAIFADKIAIDEELVRLSSHFSGFYDILDAGGAAGRKLDFLLQEINRETNTIGSKCSNLSISRKVVDIKSELEKIREQIQNIE